MGFAARLGEEHILIDISEPIFDTQRTIPMKDYVEQSELWTPDGAIVGLQAISSFSSYAFTLFPKDKTKLEIKKMIAKDNKVYIVWTADTPIVNASFATD